VAALESSEADAAAPEVSEADSLSEVEEAVSEASELPPELVEEAVAEALAEELLLVLSSGSPMSLVPHSVARQAVIPSRSLGWLVTHWSMYSRHS